MRIPVMIQMQNGENGATALCMMLGYFGRFVPMEEIREVCVSSRNGSDPADIARAAAHYGLEATVAGMEAEDLRTMPFPLMIQWRRRYYAIIKSIRNDIVTVIDPARGSYKLTFEKLRQIFTGTIITFRKTGTFQTGGKRESLFGLIRDRVRPIIRPMIAMSAFTVLCVLLNLTMIGQEKIILDRHLGTTDTVSMANGHRALLVYFLMMVLYVTFSICKTAIVNHVSRNTSARSGSQLFKNIFRQPMRFFEQYSGWELISRIENNITLDNSILKALVPRAIDVVMSVVYVVQIYRCNAAIAAICTGIMALSVVSSMKLQSVRAIAAKSMVTSGNAVNASLLNGMNMIDTIQSVGAERDFYNMWHTSQAGFNQNKMTQFRFTALSTLVTMLSRYALQATQLFMGAYLVVHGSFTLGSMALFQGILNSMTNAVINCISATDALQTMRMNIERVNDINRRKTRPAIPLCETNEADVDKLRGQLTANNICYRYNKGDRLALDNVSIEVKPGQSVAIVGPTGCGKSTLLKVLADLYEAESGEILYDGRLRSQIPDVVFHSSISTVDQETIMFEDSVYNNLRMWDSTIDNYEVILAARDAQIHERISREKKKYSAMIQENGRNFSGGELQRLELARARAHEPTLLFLDEFTSALDALTEDRVMKAIRDKGTTSVIVAHRLSTIADCDWIYVMDRGRVVQQGTHAQLYAQEGLYRTLVG